MAKKKAAPQKTAKKAATPKKSTSPKKKAAGKKTATAGKKAAPKKAAPKKNISTALDGKQKKKAAPKKAVKKAAPKKTAVKKVAKKAASKKAAKKVAPEKTTVKKVAAPKKAAVKKVVVKKVAAKKAAAKKAEPGFVEKTIASIKTAVHNIAEKVAQIGEEREKAKKMKEAAKPLSRNQLKKSSAKKSASERDSLLKDTYTRNPAVPRNTKPVDHEAFKLAKAIVNAIEEKKGENVVCLDLRDIENRVCDYFIICEGNSTTQIEAIAGSVEYLVKKELGERPYRSEGYENATWILIDYVNVIVHVFDKETRHFYNLESLWADGERITF
ncbi:MAG: ribosome silencing factor [Bacteroidia bacterium]